MSRWFDIFLILLSKKKRGMVNLIWLNNFTDMETDIEVFKLHEKRLEKFWSRVQASLVRLNIIVVWLSQANQTEVNLQLSVISARRCFYKNIKGNKKNSNQTSSLVSATSGKFLNIKCFVAYSYKCPCTWFSF